MKICINKSSVLAGTGAFVVGNISTISSKKYDVFTKASDIQQLSLSQINDDTKMSL